MLDLKTLEYQPSSKPKLPSLEMAKNAESLPERLRMLLGGDQKKDKAARFHWRLLTRLWNYAADCLPEIADSAASVDAAMRAGYNWQLGPFEMWDAVGVADTVKRMQAAGERVSPVVEAMLASGAATWYRRQRRACYDPATQAATSRWRARRAWRALRISAPATAWSGAIRARRWWTWATAWHASSCTRRRVRSAMTSCA